MKTDRNLFLKTVFSAAVLALVNGARVARGCYTGSGKRGKKVPWLSGSGFLLVADGLFEDIPSISEFPQKGLVILFR